MSAGILLQKFVDAPVQWLSWETSQSSKVAQEQLQKNTHHRLWPPLWEKVMCMQNDPKTHLQVKELPPVFVNAFWSAFKFDCRGDAHQHWQNGKHLQHMYQQWEEAVWFFVVAAKKSLAGCLWCQKELSFRHNGHVLARCLSIHWTRLMQNSLEYSASKLVAKTVCLSVQKLNPWQMSMALLHSTFISPMAANDATNRAHLGRSPPNIHICCSCTKGAVSQKRLRVGFSNVTKMPLATQWLNSLQDLTYMAFDKSTLSCWFESSPGRPMGCSSDLSGGGPPFFIGRAREHVPPKRCGPWCPERWTQSSQTQQVNGLWMQLWANWCTIPEWECLQILGISSLKSETDECWSLVVCDASGPALVRNILTEARKSAWPSDWPWPMATVSAPWCCITSYCWRQQCWWKWLCPSQAISSCSGIMPVSGPCIDS